MAEDDPNCPRCSGPVRPHWDWCERCGYDPEGLKPQGWLPETAAAPEPTAKRGRKAKREARTLAAVGAGAPAAPQDWSSPISRFVSEPIVTVPPIDLRTASAPKPTVEPESAPDTGRRGRRRRGRSIDLRDPASAPTPPPRPEPSLLTDLVAPAPAPVAPAPPARPEPSLLDSLAPPPAPVAPTAPAARPVSQLVPPIVLATPAARTSAPPTAPASAAPTRPELTYTRRPSSVETGLAGGLVLIAVAMAYLGASNVTALASGGVVNKLASGVFLLICFGLAAGLVGQAYLLMKVRVGLDGTRLVVNNRLGRPRQADLDDVFSITATTRHYDIGFGLSRDIDMPYVQLNDGDGFWIEALGGRDGAEATPEQDAVLRHLTQLVSARRIVPELPDLPS